MSCHYNISDHRQGMSSLTLDKEGFGLAYSYRGSQLWQERYSSRGMRQLAMLPPQSGSRGRWILCTGSSLLYIKPETPAHGMVPVTMKVILCASVDLFNPASSSWMCPETCLQRDSWSYQVDSISQVIGKLDSHKATLIRTRQLWHL